MVDHAYLLRDFYAPFEGSGPGKVGLEDCESLPAYLKTKESIAEKYLVRHL